MFKLKKNKYFKPSSSNIMIPIYSDFFSNFIAILCPIFIPRNVKDIPVKAKIRQAVIIVFEVRDKAIPTEKLYLL